MALYINGKLYSGDGVVRSTSDYAIYVPSGKSFDVYVGGSKVFDLSNDGTKTTLATLSGDYWRIGDAGTPIGALDEDSLLVTGILEVIGATRFRGNAQIDDNVNLAFGSASDAFIEWIRDTRRPKGLAIFHTKTFYACFRQQDFANIMQNKLILAPYGSLGQRVKLFDCFNGFAKKIDAQRQISVGRKNINNAAANRILPSFTHRINP